MSQKRVLNKQQCQQLAASPVLIRPELHDLAVPVDTVTPFPGNPRRGDQARLRQSLEQHGQYSPLLVQASTGHVVKGNNMLAVMRELGATHVAVQTLDLTDEQAKQVLAVDNRSTDDAGYDDQELIELLTSLPTLDGTGWEPDEMDDLLAQISQETVTQVAGDLAPPVLPQPPDTEARYAETPEKEAERAEVRAEQVPRKAQGLSEMILVLPEGDRQEAVRILGDLREWLGADLKAGELVLRALRTLAAVADARHHPEQSLDMGTLLAAADARPASEEQP